MKVRRKVDREDTVSLFCRQLGDWRDGLDAGVVDEDVEPAEAALDLANHRADLVRPGHVGAGVRHLDAGPLGQLDTEALSAASPKLLSVTFAPASASTVAIPRPMPLVEPVTSAV